MAKCDLCGKGVVFGHNVSHSNRKRKDGLRLLPLPAFRQDRARVSLNSIRDPFRSWAEFLLFY